VVERNDAIGKRHAVVPQRKTPRDVPEAFTKSDSAADAGQGSLRTPLNRPDW
jgi:hypothetical protein